MEENKYYIPEIEEFCVGFEFEQFDTWGSWRKFTLTEDLLNQRDIPIGSGNERQRYWNNTRVKYLDKEDILESVFILTGKPKNKFYFRTEDDRYGITLRDNFYENGLSNVHIYEFRGEGIDTLFRGKIKNKTEFIKLLKQLEIV